MWELLEIFYRNKLGKWIRTRAICFFDIEVSYRYLNVVLWCRDFFKLGGFICLGYVSLKFEEVVLGCLVILNMEYFLKFRLEVLIFKVMVIRIVFRNLSM